MIQVTESDTYIALCAIYDHCRDLTATEHPTRIQVRTVEQYISVITVMRAELVAIGWSQFDYATHISERLTAMIERCEQDEIEGRERVARLEQLGLIHTF